MVVDSQPHLRTSDDGCAADPNESGQLKPADSAIKPAESAIVEDPALEPGQAKLRADVAALKRLERAALEAWPAAEVSELDGWYLRAMQGVTRRANSAWTIEARGRLTLQERIARTLEFYRARGLPVCLYVCPVSEPAGLDAELERNGFGLEGSVSVQTATPEQVLARVPGGVDAGCANGSCVEGVCALADQAGPRFRELAVHGSRYSAVPTVYEGLLDRLRGRAWFAHVERNRVAVSSALAVRSGTELGLFSMLTRADSRRSGLARLLIGALAQRALEVGVRQIYLQVELGNDAAQRLYARCGFTERYQYHYRVLNRS
ncbi:MAG TPA: GNAT family N-acetyltransferase [Polyangiaceae bacterium]|nr:GNAT family N-acetyltransferase [Polyangiaceae bacterium]